MGYAGYRLSGNDSSQDGLDLCRRAAARYALLQVGMACFKDLLSVPLMTWCPPPAQTQTRWEKLGLLEGALGLGVALPLRVIRRGLRWLREIAKDDAWLAGWQHPKLIRRAVAAYTKLFEGILASHKAAVAAQKKRKPRRGGLFGRRSARRLRMPAQVYGFRNWPMLTCGVCLVPPTSINPYAVFTKEMKAIDRADDRLFRGWLKDLAGGRYTERFVRPMRKARKKKG